MIILVEWVLFEAYDEIKYDNSVLQCAHTGELTIGMEAPHGAAFFGTCDVRQEGMEGLLQPRIKLEKATMALQQKKFCISQHNKAGQVM